MASLKGLLTNRNPAEMIEENLETGYIYVWSPGTNYTNFCNGVCWTAKANGTAIIEIVSLGGKSVESTDLKGACDMFAMDVEDYMVAQYSRTGNVKVDQEMFPTALQKKAAKFRSKDKASVSQRIGTPGPPKGPMVNCDTEFLKIRAIISTSCPNDGLDKEPVPCSTETIMDQDDVIGVLGDARLKMMPIFTARSVREAYGNMMEERMREKRPKKPRDIIKSK